MLLDDGMDDPVGKTEPDAPVTVSSGEDEDFSSQIYCIALFVM